jgi:hypothetical protein
MHVYLRTMLCIGIVSIASSVPLGSARACSVCLAGDPIFSEHGTSGQQVGDFSAYFEFSGWKKKSGPLPGEHDDGEEEHHEEGGGGGGLGEAEEHHDEGAGHHERPVEKNKGRRLDLYLSWTPLDRLSVTLDVPFGFNDITEKEEGESLSISHDGLGDISLATSYVLWRNRDILPSTWIEGRAFIKFPTGQSKQKTKGFRDKHIQTGTGSWDYGFGMAGVHKFTWASVYASLFGRLNTEGSLDYEYGDVILANLATMVPLGHATGYSRLDPLTLGFELNFRWAAKDRFEGVRYDDSGGSLLYATPSLRFRLPWFEGLNAPSVRAAVQVPLTSRWLNGFQHEEPRWSVGIQIPF